MLGLSLGMIVFVLIIEYVAFEWSANRFNANFKNIYRASAIGHQEAGDYYLSPALGSLFKNNSPGIRAVARIGENVGSGVVSVSRSGKAEDNNNYREDKISFTDAGFFSVFTVPLVSGVPSLDDPQQAAISRFAALKYFGSTDVSGKTITVNNQFGTTSYTIAAVFENIPEQSDIRADILLSFKTLENPALRNSNDWADPKSFDAGYTYLFVLTGNDADMSNLAAQATRLFRQVRPDNASEKIAFQPLAHLHLAPGLSYPFQTYGNLLLVLSFLSIAVLILIVAWVNYVNLSTAQALRRAREVGVRKILGASRWQMMRQYITETFLLMAAGIATALIVVVMIQNLYNQFTGKQLSLSVLNQGWFWPGALLLVAGGTFFAGGYVALVLSSFDPLKTIRDKAAIKIGGVSLRKGLVVFQFTISIILIAATIILYRQLRFMQTQDLGMNIRQKVVVTGPSIVNSAQISNSIAFESQLSRLPFVEKFTASNNVPGQGYNFSTQHITRLSPNAGDEMKSYSMLIVDDKYFDTYDIRIKEGVSFDPATTQRGWSSVRKVILNEAAVRQLGLADKGRVAGQKIKWGDREFGIVGVVKDYHHLSLREVIRPTIFLPAVADGFFTVKLAAGNMSDHINQIGSIYRKTFPGEPFSYSFADEVFDTQYKSEQQLGYVFIASAGAAILIAGLGLFGLAAFAARQRIKEIGIRKVLGASVASIVQLISADFLKMIALAFVIATPIAWYAMDKWLRDFAYRISISWWIFALAGLVAVLVALLTIGLQAVKAATTNPVTSLRSE